MLRGSRRSPPPRRFLAIGPLKFLYASRSGTGGGGRSWSWLIRRRTAAVGADDVDGKRAWSARYRSRHLVGGAAGTTHHANRRPGFSAIAPRVSGLDDAT